MELTARDENQTLARYIFVYRPAYCHQATAMYVSIPDRVLEFLCLACVFFVSPAQINELF
jgi:hypothetical protein